MISAKIRGNLGYYALIFVVQLLFSYLVLAYAIITNNAGDWYLLRSYVQLDLVVTVIILSILDCLAFTYIRKELPTPKQAVSLVIAVGLSDIIRRVAGGLLFSQGIRVYFLLAYVVNAGLFIVVYLVTSGAFAKSSRVFKLR